MKPIGFWQAVFSILALAISILFFVHTWDVLMPFLFGVVIAYLLNPLVDWFTALGLRRSRVVLVLYIVFLTASVILGSWLLPGLYREANTAFSNLPAYAADLDSIIQNANKEIQAFLKNIIGHQAPKVTIPLKADKLLETLFYKLPANLMNIAHVGLWIFIIPFVSFFALSEGKSAIDRVFSWTPSDYVENLLGLMAEINATLGGYVRGLILESTCVGLLTLAGLLALGLKGAILISVITALLNMVPFMALLIGGGIALLAGYFQSLSFSALLGIIVLYIAIRVIDDIAIIPFVMGANVKLHPVFILFAVLAGVELGGFVGLVFAIPVAAVIKVVFALLIRDRQEGVIAEKQHVYS